MPPNDLRSESRGVSDRPYWATDRLSHLQTTLVLKARARAADEISAAIAHQLNGPLTALLVYLHEIKDKARTSADTDPVASGIAKMAERALGETERICSIMERTRQMIDAPVDAESVVERGREAIDWLTRGGDANARRAFVLPPGADQELLTAREREVLDLIASGTSNKEGAHQLGISKRTFEAHRAHIMRKLGAKNAADLVRVTLTEI